VERGVGVGVPGVSDGVGVIPVLAGDGDGVDDGGSVQIQVTGTGFTRSPFIAVPENTKVSLAGQGRFEIVTFASGGTVPPCGLKVAGPEACQWML
jgi:hypothetical protein